jgi:hypothetical protein
VKGKEIERLVAAFGVFGKGDVRGMVDVAGDLTQRARREEGTEDTEKESGRI